MVKSCSAKNCKQRYSKDSEISFHHFPTNLEMKVKWILAMERDDFIPSKYSVLCSQHFNENDFLRLEPTKILKPDAIPSKFKNNQKYKNNKRANVKARDDEQAAESAENSAKNSSLKNGEAEMGEESSRNENSDRNMEVNEIELISNYIKQSGNKEVEEVSQDDLMSRLSQLENESAGNQIEIIDCDDVDLESNSTARSKTE